MAILESLTFKDWSGDDQTVRFLSAPATPAKQFETTIVTGQNGSHKSTLLRELVAALTIHGRRATLRLLSGADGTLDVICVSGSVADRFPLKETTGGRTSEYAVPNYSYLGQRVGPNLLSKKRPLETMLTFALSLERRHRFDRDFFELAHRSAGIHPTVEYDLIVKRRNKSVTKLDVLGTIQARAKDSSVAAANPLANVSVPMAQWLLDEFHYDEFNELQQLALARSGRIKLLTSTEGAVSESASNPALRLGLITDLLSLTDARVTSRVGGSKFSAFDLSSGEYHMYTSVLGLGFGVTETSVILIDEPENSLHPQWQRTFMDAVYGICRENLMEGHLVVCTHSPLIVATAPEGGTVVDLTPEAAAVERVSFGASADELLVSQFGVASSRNRIVVDTVQRAVALIEHSGYNDPALVAMHNELVGIRDALGPDDPDRKSVV